MLTLLAEVFFFLCLNFPYNIFPKHELSLYGRTILFTHKYISLHLQPSP